MLRERPGRRPMPPFDPDHPREECGVFAVHGHPDAAALTVLGLHALQHRGQEAAGIVSGDGERFHVHRGRGQVGDVFDAKAGFRPQGNLPGSMAVGHVRYATTGAGDLANVQPLFANTAIGGVAIAHNGNLTNAGALRERLVKAGQLFQGTTDTETILQLLARSWSARLVDRLIEALKSVEGAYSLAVLGHDGLIAVRDPHGVRPLVLGRLDGAVIVASETCALDIIGAEYWRDVEPGEVVLIDGTGVQSLHPFPAAPKRLCVFEYIYFGRPDSRIDARSVSAARDRIGRELAREHPAPADIVIPVPDSGVLAALGYAAESGLRYRPGILRGHYRGRTFIEPSAPIRHLGVKLKLSVDPEVVAGQRLAVVDDSIVRGTTMPQITALLRRAGAREIHIRIASPPFRSPCFYGIDTPELKDLMAAQHSKEAITAMLGADSVEYLSIEALYRALGAPPRDQGRSHCDACFTGDYPISPPPGALPGCA